MFKSSLPHWRIQMAVRYLANGGIVAYPTEAVFGLGCDPFNEQAVQRILELKNRPINKGLILIAAEFAQIAPLIKVPDNDVLNNMLSTWPGPTTWVVRANASVPPWLRGSHDSLAVRITNHPIASDLCLAFNQPLVSTSANITGFQPAKTTLKVRQLFGISEILIVPGPLGQETRTTAIFDAKSGNKIR